MSQGEMGHGGEWRIAVKGEQRGPFTLDQVRAMIAEGRLPADALVWKPGMANWAPLGSVAELTMSVSRGPMPGPAASPVAIPVPAATALPPSGPSPLGEFLAFRRMLTLVLIQVLFWIGIAGCVLTALGQLFMGFQTRSLIMGIFMALVTIVVGPIVVRVHCELMILFVRIHDTLQEIKEQRK
jgi:hypothetical protein